MKIDRLDRSWIIESAAILFVVVSAFAGCCLMLAAAWPNERERVANPYELRGLPEFDEADLVTPNPLFEGEKR